MSLVTLLPTSPVTKKIRGKARNRWFLSWPTCNRKDRSDARNSSLLSKTGASEPELCLGILATRIQASECWNTPESTSVRHQSLLYYGPQSPLCPRAGPSYSSHCSSTALSLTNTVGLLLLCFRQAWAISPHYTSLCLSLQLFPHQFLEHSEYLWK